MGESYKGGWTDWAVGETRVATVVDHWGEYALLFETPNTISKVFLTGCWKLKSPFQFLPNLVGGELVRFSRCRVKGIEANLELIDKQVGSEGRVFLIHLDDSDGLAKELGIGDFLAY
jgi:hypothetical protein